MKTRAFLTIAFLPFLILPLLLFWFASSSFVATPPLSHAPAVASPTLTPTPTPQTLGEKITQSEKNVFDPIIALLNYGTAVLITVLVLFLLWRIWHLSSLSNLVIDPFNNATGDEALGKALPGFNQLTREKLEPVLTKVHRHFNTFKAPDLDPLKPLPCQQVQAYYNVGEQLHMLGLYEEAIHYFEEALKQDKAFHGAAQKLSTSVSYLQMQKSAASAYAIGKQLQDAGLLIAAIES